MSVTDADVRAALRHATDHLTSPPSIVDDVRRGGRRRLVRRRGLLAAGLAVVASAATAGAVSLRGSRPMEIASPLLDEPTRGDLAGDRVFLDRAREAWRRQAEQSTGALYGDPQVVWAGNTPAGPAAFVAQRTPRNPVVSGEGDRLFAYAAFLQPTAGGLRLMTVYQLDDGHPIEVPAALMGPDRGVLVVLDVGESLEFSPALRYAADGRISRDFQPVRFVKGAAVMRVPAQREKITFALARAPLGRPRDLTDGFDVVGTHEVLFPGGRDRPDPPAIEHLLAGAERIWSSDPAGKQVQHEASLSTALAPYVDAGGLHVAGPDPSLSVYGLLPDGRGLMVTTIQYDDDPARVIALRYDGAGFARLASGFVARTAPLPIRLRLPGGQGVFVAAEGATLRYRTAGDGWLSAGRDAALLPAAATQVLVVRGASTATVPLT